MQLSPSSYLHQLSDWLAPQREDNLLTVFGLLNQSSDHGIVLPGEASSWRQNTLASRFSKTGSTLEGKAAKPPKENMSPVPLASDNDHVMPHPSVRHAGLLRGQRGSANDRCQTRLVDLRCRFSWDLLLLVNVRSRHHQLRQWSLPTRNAREPPEPFQC